MATFVCEQSARRQQLLDQTAAPGTRINGLDYLIVSDGDAVPIDIAQRVLRVRFFFVDRLATLLPAHFRIRGGVREIDPPIRWVVRMDDINDPGGPGVDPTFDPILTAADRTYLASLPASVADPDQWFVIFAENYGDFSRYELQLRDGSAIPAGFDRRFSTINFSFKVECPSPLDCEAPGPAIEAPKDAPEIDYLARDFSSARRMMVERLGRLRPGVGVDDVGLEGAILDVLAYSIDHLSYYQDAVSTEAYLGTARRRISVRRHARLLGYRMHEGVNARVFVHLQMRGGVTLARGALRAGAELATRIAGEGPSISRPVTEAIAAAFPAQPKIFGALHASGVLSHAHNEITFHSWGDADCRLEKGSTEATLRDPGGLLDLLPGDFLALERIRDRPSEGGGPEDPQDPDHRFVVRLIEVGPLDTDELLGHRIRRVRWHEEDALPEDLWIDEDGQRLAVARANLVLVDHGLRILREPVTTQAYGVAINGAQKSRAKLSRPSVVFRQPYPEALDVSARALLVQDPAAARPDVSLALLGETWLPAGELLNATETDREFVVEVENDGAAHLRFGDGILGRNPGPGTRFEATYRVGTGSTGHVGAESIAHLFFDPALVDAALVAGLAAVRNPLPSAGWIRPQSIDDVKLRAPQAFRRQERAVTVEDWAEKATELEEVQRAVAYIRWSGAWPTVYLHLDLVGGRELDTDTEERLLEQLDRYRLTGYELELVRPVYVPLDIRLTVCVEAGHYREHVLQRLEESFGAGVMPSGEPGFFHPDKVTFGQSVFLSQIVSRVMAIPGVRWVDTRTGIGPAGRLHTFKRWGRASSGELAAGRIDVGALEIIRCDSDPNFPDRGRIEFYLQGGS